jgi:hypothetical protein
VLCAGVFGFIAEQSGRFARVFAVIAALSGYIAAPAVHCSGAGSLAQVPELIAAVSGFIAAADGSVEKHADMRLWGELSSAHCFEIFR